jgi:hypothetical protein
LKQQSLTPEYVEFIKWSKWNGKLPETIAGGGATLLNIGK